MACELPWGPLPRPRVAPRVGGAATLLADPPHCSEALAWLATPASSAPLDLGGADIGSLVWYARWRDAYVRGNETLGAGALRAWVFLTTPHEQILGDGYLQRGVPSVPEDVGAVHSARRLQPLVASFFANISIPCGGALGDAILQCQGGAGTVSYTCPTLSLQVMMQ